LTEQCAIFKYMTRALLIANPENATIAAPSKFGGLDPIERIWLMMKARRFNNDVCKNEEKLLERLGQAIFDVIKNLKKI